MEVVESNVDDILHTVLNCLIENGKPEKSTKGPYRELNGVLIKLTNPLARLSRTDTKGTLFSCLGELAWYLSGTNELEFIQHYIRCYDDYTDDNGVLHGAYGPRLINLRGKYNQLLNVINKLKEKPSTRKAVIQLFDAEDIVEEHNDVPCTLTLQLLVREDKLHMVVSMRSNDAFVGMPHDIFVFTMLQEIIARTLNIELGEYIHFIANLHLYDKNYEDAKVFLQEGFMSTNNVMGKMSTTPLEGSLPCFMKFEEMIRKNQPFDFNNVEVDNYWLDLLKLLKIFSLSRSKTEGCLKEIELLQSSISNKSFLSFVLKRKQKL